MHSFCSTKFFISDTMISERWLIDPTGLWGLTQSENSSWVEYCLPTPGPLTAQTHSPDRAAAVTPDAQNDAPNQHGLAGLKHSAQEVEDRDIRDADQKPSEIHFPEIKFTEIKILIRTNSHSQSLSEGWIKSFAIFQIYLRVTDDGRVHLVLFENKQKLMIMLTHYALSSSLASRNSGQIKPVIWHNCSKETEKETLKKQSDHKCQTPRVYIPPHTHGGQGVVCDWAKQPSIPCKSLDAFWN